MTREVDFFIIGAGIAGMTLYRYLGERDVVIVDPRPGRYKIGESLTPQHFFPRELRPVIEQARKLPSASDKLGTMFVTEGGVSLFYSYYDAHLTMHADRRELEALYRRMFEVPIREESVEEIDFEARVVRTSGGTYRVRRQILDCSGPAMVVARKLGLAYEIWPVYAGWAYWDVTARRDRRFWQKLREDGTRFQIFDDARERMVTAEVEDSQRPTATTMLKRLKDGVWSWQIPLYDATLLSFGIVSRHQPVTAETYLRMAPEALGAQYEATMRQWTRASPHDIFHRRDRFAWASRTFAAPGWALVGDAAFFGDPVYSVGTGLATNQAIRLAELLQRYPWEEGAWKIYERQTRQIFERAKRAYDHWYGGDVTSRDDVAHEVQAGFLNGQALHFRLKEMFDDITNAAEPEFVSVDEPTRGDPGQEITEIVPEPFVSLDGWTLEKAVLRNGGAELRFAGGDQKSIGVTVRLWDADERFYRRVGPFALSYQGEFDAATKSFFDAFSLRLAGQQKPMLFLLELRPAAA